jgi:hypothetical protein
MVYIVEEKSDVSYRYLIPVKANALYAFKSRGFGGEVGLITGN